LRLVAPCHRGPLAGAWSVSTCSICPDCPGAEQDDRPQIDMSATSLAVRTTRIAG
jgi:hypothetical protein